LGQFSSLSYSLIDRDEKKGLLISAQEKDYAPPWLKTGFTVDGLDPDNVQFTFGARVTMADVGGYRSELRTDFSIGSRYSLGTEYYHPLTTTSRWFIAPNLYASRASVNLYAAGTFLAEYKFNQVHGGLDLGYAIDRFSRKLACPARLAAYGLNQFLTNQYFYFRGGYLHRLGKVPSLLGHGLFLDVHYEVAKPYGLPNAPTLPNDGVVGLITETIFGPILVGGSLGTQATASGSFSSGECFNR
jgi:hypothetical protein